MESLSALNINKYELGSVIVSEKSPKGMVVILQGNVGVYKNHGMHDELFVKSVSDGSFYCERSLFMNQEHDVTLIALTEVLAIIVTRNNVNEFYVKYPAVAFSITENIYKWLAEAHAAVKEAQPSIINPGLSGKSPLFPEGHGNYTLQLTNDNKSVLSMTQSACPLCGRKFDTHYILMSKLRREKTDPDLRARYRETEPMYYNILSCPNCLFSAESASFTSAPKKYADEINNRLGQYRSSVKIKTGQERDTFTVFAGYYLALLCAPIAFDNHELTTAGLWLKISRLYEDCKDKKMYMYAVRQALDAYNHVYSNVRINDKQSQQVRFMLGDLYFKTADYDRARQFFYMIKSDKMAPATLMRPVEERLETIREIKQQNPDS
jgi:hypothetical protein